MKKCSLLLFFGLLIGQLFSQNQRVQSFDFKSTTRDTVVEFPEGDHTRFEKILMHYGMRCKNALVSSVNDRNRGCGEWDYSCNTYIVDSTKVDSLKQVDPDYIISGFSEDEFPYTTQKTYNFIQRDEREVSVVSGSPQLISVKESEENLKFELSEAAPYLDVTYLLQAQDLITQGLEPGAITAIQFPILDGELNIEGLKIQMQSLATDAILEDVSDDSWQEVYHLTTALSAEDNRLEFYNDYAWDGNSIAVRLSYGSVSGSALELMGQAVENEDLEYTQARYENYAEFGISGNLHVSEGLDQVSDEITVSFWQYGLDQLPVGSTIFEARDVNNRRQLNIHLPWGNSQVYWDCGGEGAAYDRINAVVDASKYKGQWNHWAFTKDAVSGVMNIYVNGELFLSGEDRFRKISASDMNIGSAIINTNSRSYSKMSEFRLWNKALDEATIKEWMHKEISDDHPFRSNLIHYYKLNTENLIEDSSNNNHVAEVEGQIGVREWRIGESVVSKFKSNILPAHSFDQGEYQKVIRNIAIIDSIENLPNKVDHYVLEGTDRVFESTQLLYQAGLFPIINEQGELVGEVEVPAEDVISIQQLDHYSKQPMEIEIMSFVTPYGINLDFGEEGESWTFDVTDYAPILKGKKRMFMSRGGQWQEEMDIWFEFIEGTPARDVIDLEQIWPVRSIGYERINDDWRFEPRVIRNDPSITDYIVKTTITGHGQEGEFIPRRHTTTIGTQQTGQFGDTWLVWKECADNPVYPQGGTWVYDRAGWCPGAASDTREFRITDFVRAWDSLAVFDYDVEVASGDSRYIVSSQLVSYGPPNKELDLAVEDVIYPTSKIEHRRFNPTCQNPIVELKNYGSLDITSALINYGIVGKETYGYRFEGNISFLNSRRIELYFLDDLLELEEGDVFFATVAEVNGEKDPYDNNDTYMTEVNPVDFYGEDIVIEYRTNSQPGETFYQVFDGEGNPIHSRVNGAANTIYRDTLRNLNGCYQLYIEDSDNDGIAWWANGDGTGYLRIKDISGTPKIIEPDFGMFTEYNFTAGMVSSIKDVNPIGSFSIFPNPSSSKVHFANLEDWDFNLDVEVFDQLGRSLVRKAVDKHRLADGLFEIDQLSSGIYFISLKDTDRKATVRLIKE